jgi:hypothetical protein
VIEHQPDDERSHAADQVQVTVLSDSAPLTIHWRYAATAAAILAILGLALGISQGIGGGAGSHRRLASVSPARVNDSDDSASVSASYFKSEVFEVRMGVREPDGDEP